MSFRFRREAVYDHPRNEASQRGYQRNQPQAMRANYLLQVAAFGSQEWRLVGSDYFQKEILRNPEQISEDLGTQRTDYAQNDRIDD
jgi:hypothetical protein